MRSAQTYRVRISLVHSDPEIWRLFQASGDLPLSATLIPTLAPDCQFLTGLGATDSLWSRAIRSESGIRSFSRLALQA